MSSEDIFEQRMRLSKLFVLYAGLLTEKQQQCLSLYFDDDLSLSEIAEELDVSRQAVHDLLKRVEQTLERYESRLGLLECTDAAEVSLRRAIDLLNENATVHSTEVIAILDSLCGKGR